MSKVVKFGLSVKEVQNAIKEIKAYQSDLNRKCELLCQRLCAEGILIAQAHIGSSGFGKYIHLGSEITPQQAGCNAILYMKDTSKVQSEWQTLDGVQSAEVSPCLMLEFGSGLKAENPSHRNRLGNACPHQIREKSYSRRPEDIPPYFFRYLRYSFGRCCRQVSSHVHSPPEQISVGWKMRGPE